MTAEHPTPPAPGSVYRATHGTATARLVLVTHTPEPGDPVVRVRLLTNEVEMATSADALLRREATGRRYDLLAHDLPGYLLPGDLSAALFTINLAEDLVGPLALPLVSRTDPRWAWKEAELDALRALQPPLAVILGEVPPPGDLSGWHAGMGP